MSLLDDRDRPGAVGVLARIITAWALMGGVVLCLIVAANVASVLATAFGGSFAGAFELTEVGVAIAAFAFLPYCQLQDENVTADIFTSGLPDRAVAALTAVASAVALIFGAVLLWRMSLGLADQRTYGYTTAILQLPVWWAFVPILVSLALLCAAAVVSLFETGHKATTGDRWHG